MRLGVLVGQQLGLSPGLLGVAEALQVVVQRLAHAGAAAFAELAGQLIELALDFRFQSHPEHHSVKC